MSCVQLQCLMEPLLTHCFDWIRATVAPEVQQCWLPYEELLHYVKNHFSSSLLMQACHTLLLRKHTAHLFTLNVKEDEDEDEEELSDRGRWDLWRTLTKSAQLAGWASPGGTCDRRCCWPWGKTWGCWRPGRAPWLAVTAPRWRWWHGRRVTASAMIGTSEGCRWHCIARWQWPPGWRWRCWQKSLQEKQNKRLRKGTLDLGLLC